MTVDRAIELMKIEKLCVERANWCGRDCANCALVQEDSELLEAYDIALLALKTVQQFVGAMDFDCFDRKKEEVTAQ